ncbi:Putative invertase inhibitor [Glycine soja]|nr:Putative invertase inhibitor [Glycine soja]
MVGYANLADELLCFVGSMCKATEHRRRRGFGHLQAHLPFPNTLSYVHELQSNSSAANGSNNNIYASRCLSDYAEEYSEAIENLKDSKEALANGDCDQVDTLVSAAMSDAETCEDGFKDMQSGDSDSTSPLTERNRYFSELCSNALAITKLLV